MIVMCINSFTHKSKTTSSNVKTLCIFILNLALKKPTRFLMRYFKMCINTGVMETQLVIKSSWSNKHTQTLTFSWWASSISFLVCSRSRIRAFYITHTRTRAHAHMHTRAHTHTHTHTHTRVSQKAADADISESRVADIKADICDIRL